MLFRRILPAVLLAGSLSSLALFAQPEAALLHHIDARLSDPRLPAATRLQLTAAREDSLYKLMKISPASAQAFFPAAGIRQFSGRASALIEDNFDTGQSRLRWRLTTVEGDIREVYFDAPPPALNCESTVELRGFELRNRIIAAGAPQVAAAAASPTCTTTGPQNIAVLLIQFPSTPLPASVTKANAQAALFGATRSVDAYWREASYGATSASGAVFGPFTLAQDYTCDQADAIFAAALTAASSSVTFANYTRITMIIPNVGSCSIGLGQVGCSWFSSPQGQVLASPIWIRADYAGSAEYILGIEAHELGHNLGLNHSGFLDFGSVSLGMFGGGSFSEYQDMFSVMGSFFGISQGSILAGHYGAPHKSQLGWFPNAANVQQTQTNGTYTIQPYETPSTGLQALKVKRGLNADAWLWVEYRQPLGFDFNQGGFSSNLFPGSALIHYDDPGYDPTYTRLIDFNLSPPNNAASQSPMQVGSSWSDPYSLLNLTVNSSNSGGLNITTSYDQPCAALSAATMTVGAPGGTSSVTVTAPSNCNWTATSSDSWLTVTSGASGSGNGTVGLSAAANSTTQSRSAILAIQRQPVAVTQSGVANSPPVVVSVTPGSGSGTGGVFQFAYSDSNGANDIQWVAGSFANGGGTCLVYVAMASQGILLLADDGVTYLGPIYLGSNGTLENSSCKFYAAGSSIDVGSNTVTFTARVDFKAALGGTITIAGSASDAAGTGGTLRTLGTWQAPCSYSLGANSAQATAAGGAASVQLTTSGGCGWAAASNAAWITVPPASASGTGSAQVNYSVVSNASPSTRQGTLTVAGLTFTVNQAGTCSYSLNPQSVNVLAGSGSTNTVLTTGSSCAWTAASNAAWISVTSPQTGTGGSTVSLSYGANPNLSPRSGTATIGGQTFTINQAANCPFSLTATALNVSFVAGSGSTTLTTLTGCAWTAVTGPNSSWITISPATAAGATSGPVNFSFAANFSTSARVGTVIIGSQTLTVTQAPYVWTSRVGVFRAGQWWLDANGDHSLAVPPDLNFSFGQAGDIPIVSDWDNTGSYRVGVFRSGQWWLDINGDHQWTVGQDMLISYGMVGDIPVTGDWDNTGRQRIGIFRNGQWWLDMNGDHKWTADQDLLILYGQAGDLPVFGDWDNTGRQRIGVFRNGQWLLDMNGDHQWTSGQDLLFGYGQAGDLPLVGDWDNTGRQRIGVFRGGQWLLDINGDHQWTAGIDLSFVFGQAGDRPVLHANQ